MSKPVIGISAPARRLQHAWWFARRGVEAAGATAHRLMPGAESSSFRDIDGLILGGGSDVDPNRYREEPKVESVYDPGRDAFEWEILDHAFDRNLPILGICRGAQLINVFRGGSLHQDLAAAVPGFRPRRMVFARKAIQVEANTRLLGILGTQRLRVNSLHRQGVNRVADGFRVAARDAAGAVQAIEEAITPHRFVVGVQWHPEYLLQHARQRRLFEALVVAATRHAGQSGVE